MLVLGLLETDGETCDWVLDLDRKLGLARDGLGHEVVVVVVDGMDVVLERLVQRRKVPKAEMLETHANGFQFQRIFAPDVIFPEIKCVAAGVWPPFWDEIGSIFLDFSP